MAAEEKAKQSARLHGEYSVWDFGDRPADVIADVRKARDREKISATVRPPVGSRNMDAGVASRPNMDPNSRATSTIGKELPAADRGSRYGETKRPAATADAADALTRKKMAVSLMQEAMALRVSGNYVEARKKLTEADKLNAWFSKDDDTPAMLLARAQRGGPEEGQRPDGRGQIVPGPQGRDGRPDDARRGPRPVRRHGPGHGRRRRDPARARSR